MRTKLGEFKSEGVAVIVKMTTYSDPGVDVVQITQTIDPLPDQETRTLSDDGSKSE